MASIDSIKQSTYDPRLYEAQEVCTAGRGLGSIDFQAYRRDGFAGAEGVFDAAQVQAARDGLSHLIMGKVEEFKGVQFETSAREKLERLSLAEREAAVRKLMTFCKFEQRLDAMMRDAGLLAAISKMLGGREPVCFQEMALLKPPGGREKPWHQDHAYFNLEMGEPVVGVWIALDDAAVENGCMHVIRGSHRDGAVAHFSRRDWQICDTGIVGHKITAVPLKAGGLMLFDGLLHHGTPANHTQLRRRALQFHYCAKDAKWTDEAAHAAVFGGEGKGMEC